MAIVRFEDFEFDSKRYLLKYQGRTLQLRPKALQLLCMLIENRERVVTKSEILSSLWGSKYARDHLLFQLISELRHSPFNSDFIRTQPNLGYQWNVATVAAKPKASPIISLKVSLAKSIAASLTIIVMCFSALQLTYRNEHKAVSLQLPAQNALIKGVIAMEKGNTQQAIEWFEFGLNENPNSAELSLFLAETLLQHNDIEESSNQLQSLLQKQNLGDYERMTAIDLLSKVRQRQGKLYDALNYAEASSSANIIAQCTVDALEQRVQTLAEQLAAPKLEGKNNSKLAEIAKPKMSSQTATVDNATTDKLLEEYRIKCGQLTPTPKETSSCEPENWSYLHANSEQGDNSKNS